MKKSERPLFYFSALLLLTASLQMIANSQAHCQEPGQSPPVYDVVIVGGGLAGMTAAYYLKEYNIKILEKRNRVGGRAFSRRYKEFTYACGAEYLGKLYGPLKKITRKLKLNVREIPYPMDVHYHSNQFYYGEMGRALMIAEDASLKDFNRFVSLIKKIYKKYKDVPEFDLNSDLAKLDMITAHRWFDQMQFPEVITHTYNVTFRGLFGATSDEISALSALTEIVFDYEDIRMKEFADKEELENDPTPGKYHTGSYSLDKGIAEIPLAIAKHLGAKVQANSTVIEVQKPDDNYTVTYLDAKNEPHHLRTSIVIFATPAPITLKIAANLLSAEQKSILQTIPYAPFVTVALYSSKPIFNQGFDLAVPDGLFFTDVYDATWIQRFYNPSLKDAQTYITTIYIPPESHRSTRILSMSDMEIMEKVYRDLETIFPQVKQIIEGYDIYRFKYAYPVMTPGAYRRLSKLHEITKGSLLLAGDYTIYPTLEAAADSGVLAAEKAEDWLEQAEEEKDE
ncbi:flavin monoamine oxidase family protein [Thermodesulfobacteriota bacterium]